MKLSVFERLILLNVLPEQGNLLTMKVVQNLRGALAFDEAELVALEFQGPDEKGRIEWRTEADVVTDVDIGPKSLDIIRKRLEELDKAGQLTVQHLPLCEKFGIGSET